MKKLCIIICLLVCASWAFASEVIIPRSSLVSAKPKLTVYHAASKPIMLSKTNQHFIIELKSNRTTGYSWFTLSYPRHLLILDKQIYIAPKMSMPGKAGVARWYFSVKPSAFKAAYFKQIRLLYARPWELSKTNIKDLKPLVFSVISQPVSE